MCISHRWSQLIPEGRNPCSISREFSEVGFQEHSTFSIKYRVDEVSFPIDPLHRISKLRHWSWAWSLLSSSLSTCTSDRLSWWHWHCIIFLRFHVVKHKFYCFSYFASCLFYEISQKRGIFLKITAKKPTRNSSIRTSRILVQEFYPLVLN